MSSPATLDVSALPTEAFGHRSPLWWGMVMLIAIEGTTMGLLLVTYFYLRGNFQVWPPAGVGAPALRLAAIEAALLVVSYLPTMWAVRSARREQLAPTRSWLLVAAVLGLAVLVVRWFEIKALPFRWDANAHASVFYMTMGLHVTHVLTSVIEDAMIIALLFIGPVERKHYGDIEATALLWYFTVLEWVPGFAILYLEPLLRP